MRPGSYLFGARMVAPDGEALDELRHGIRWDVEEHTGAGVDVPAIELALAWQAVSPDQ